MVDFFLANHRTLNGNNILKLNGALIKINTLNLDLSNYSSDRYSKIIHSSSSHAKVYLSVVPYLRILKSSETKIMEEGRKIKIWFVKICEQRYHMRFGHLLFLKNALKFLTLKTSWNSFTKVSLKLLTLSS